LGNGNWELGISNLELEAAFNRVFKLTEYYNLIPNSRYPIPSFIGKSHKLDINF